MNPLLRGSAAHVFVSSVDDPELDDVDRHHLLRVLRLRDGAAVTVSDGAGSWRPCRLDGQRVAPAGDPEFVAAPADVRIAAAIPKGDRLDWMVQKLTEVGVTELCLLHCERSVVRWDPERSRSGLERVRRIAREAAMQSRRVHLPTVDGPWGFEDVVSRPGVVLADPTGSDEVRAEWVLIGPEGGFGPTELAHDVPRCSLGVNVLRIETAAVVAAVLLQTVRR